MSNKIFPSLLIIGPARHGKDTFAEILRDNFGLKFKSSSQSAADIFIYAELKEKYGYTTPEECFEDRVNHRQEWYEMICDYNKDDRAKLAKEILTTTDCYVGMRDRGEIDECLKQGLFDLIVWVDASSRLPMEGKESFNIDKSCADIIITNNGTLGEFVNKVNRLGRVLTGELIDISDRCGDGDNFLEHFSRYAVIDEEYQLDIEMFTSRANIKGWPDTKLKGDGPDLYAPVELRRWDIESLNSYAMVITCAGLEQIPLTITLKCDDNGIYVDYYEKCENWLRGMSGYEVFKILQDPCNN